ncbi:hypothetical protein ACFSLT_15655 [Novosphingobium resinovorum]
MKAEVALLRGDAKAALATLGNETSVDGWRVRAEAQLALGDEEAARDAFEKGMKAGAISGWRNPTPAICWRTVTWRARLRCLERCSASRHDHMRHW